MLTRRIFFRVGLAAVLTSLLISCGDDPPVAGGKNEVLVLSAIPDEKITNQQAKFSKLADYLEGRLGVEVEFLFSKDYADAVTKFRNGETHLVWFGGLSGVQARMAVDGAKAIAQGKSDPLFKSYLIANVATGLETSEEFPMGIKSRSFTFGSPGSTSGRLMPTYFITKETGSAPEAWFEKKPGFQLSGGHVATAHAVADGTYDLGMLNYRTYDSLVESEQKIRERTRIIWTTPPYADYNFTIHPEVEVLFGEGMVERVREALIEAPAGSDALKAINRESIISAKNEDFEGIREVAEEVGLIRE
ncbi:MAG: putative selenate ABC transporter substrate-binding protein [Verrucomicrobiota bacterium]